MNINQQNEISLTLSEAETKNNNKPIVLGSINLYMILLLIIAAIISRPIYQFDFPHYSWNSLREEEKNCVRILCVCVIFIRFSSIFFNFIASSILKTNQSVHKTLGSCSFWCENHCICTESTWNQQKAKTIR